jgi:hypothetical protein
MAQRFWPGQDPIGKRFRREADSAWRTVVGVVGDVRQESLDAPMAPQYYVPLSTLEEPPASLAFVVATTRPDEIASDARRAVASADPSLPIFSFGSLRASRLDALGGRRLALLLMSVFAAAVLSLCAAGTYGVVALSVAQRTREIGIRSALGSSRSAIVRLFVCETAGALLGGGVAGLAAWLAGAGFALSFFSGGGSQLPVVTAAFAVLAGTGLLAAYLPAHRASRIDPLEALRYE